MDSTTIISYLRRIPAVVNRADLWLGVLAAVVLKGLVVPKASLLSNVIHIVHKLLEAIQRPMHCIPESDLGAINKQRRLYAMTTFMEPKFATIQETLSFQSAAGHTLSIDLHKPVGLKGKICPLVIYIHGGGFVLGKVSFCLPRHFTYQF